MVSWISLRRPSITAAPIESASWRSFLFAGVAIGIWLSLFLYIDSLSLPFFEDDVIHIRWLSRLSSPFSPFITADGVPAYRPLGKTILKLWYLLLGRHDAAWLRFLNISMHNLDIALVAALAFRLDRSRWRYVTAGLAAMLFAVLPFAYQAIPWINVFFYPLNSLLQLLMVLFYWEARTRRSNSLLVLALALCALSPFEIEYGLMSSGLLLAVEIVLLLQKRQKAIWFSGPLLGLAFNIGFLIAWQFVPKNAYQFGPPTLERMMQIAFYLLQGITYPASPLVLPLMNRFALNDLSSIAIVGLPLLILAVGLLTYRRKWPLLVMSLLWFALLNLPGFITLTFDYFINSPRLLYPVGPAMAWLWAGFFTSLLDFGRQRKSRLVIAGATALVVLIVIGMNIDFVHTRMVHYHIVEDSVHQLGAVAREAPTDDELLMVNMPAWITPPDRVFALGNNGIQFIPFYTTLNDFVFAVNDQDHPTRAIQFHNVRTQQPYFYGMHGQRVEWDKLRENLATTGEVYLTQYTPERISLAFAGRATDVDWEGDAQEDKVTTFDDRLGLILADHKVEGDTLELTLEWQLQAAIAEDLTVFVHLYGPDGQLVAQADGYPLRGLSPFWLWEPGRTLRDQRSLTWPADAPVGNYTVAVGVYDSATGDRLPAVDASGEPLPDNAAVVLQFDRP